MVFRTLIDVPLSGVDLKKARPKLLEQARVDSRQIHSFTFVCLYIENTPAQFAEQMTLYARQTICRKGYAPKSAVHVVTVIEL